MKSGAPLVLLLLAGIAGCEGDDRGNAAEEPPEKSWLVPLCSFTTHKALTYTINDGFGRAGWRTGDSGGRPTGMAVLENRGGVIFAAVSSELWRSTDAGCTWRHVASFDDVYFRLIAGSREPVYAFPAFGGNTAFRISPRGELTQLSLPFNVYGWGVDRANSLHVRALANLLAPSVTRQIVESFDGGLNWTPIGQPLPAPLAPSYSDFQPGVLVEDSPSNEAGARFEPDNLDHILVTYRSTGAVVSFDGGQNWTQSSGFDDFINHGLAAAIGADGSNAWVATISRDSSGQFQREGLFHSSDGGLTFSRLTESSIGLSDEAVYAHPTDPDVAYYVDNLTIYRHDAASGQLVSYANPGRISAAAFNPLAPEFIYLGIRW